MQMSLPKTNIPELQWILLVSKFDIQTEEVQSCKTQCGWAMHVFHLVKQLHYTVRKIWWINFSLMISAGEIDKNIFNSYVAQGLQAIHKHSSAMFRKGSFRQLINVTHGFQIMAFASVC